MITLTTTGLLSSVIIDDLGAIKFSHPIVDNDLLLDYSLEELRDSVDLGAAITNGYITLKHNNIAIANDTELKNIEAVQSIGDLNPNSNSTVTSFGDIYAATQLANC